MFEIGQKVLYGQTGVCIIDAITEKELIKNNLQTYYVLKPLYQQNNIIYAPVLSEKVFIRPIMTKAQAENLISRIPEIKAKPKKCEPTPEDLRGMLSSHNTDDLVELTGYIYEKKKTASASKKKLGFSDEKFMKTAEALLFGELAAALEIPVESVPDYIKASLK